jgi:hypothetical protein
MSSAPDCRTRALRSDNRRARGRSSPEMVGRCREACRDQTPAQFVEVRGKMTGVGQRVDIEPVGDHNLNIVLAAPSIANRPYGAPSTRRPAFRPWAGAVCSVGGPRDSRPRCMTSETGRARPAGRARAEKAGPTRFYGFCRTALFLHLVPLSKDRGSIEPSRPQAGC